MDLENFDYAIDNVPDFFRILGHCENYYQLLMGRCVFHVSRGKGVVWGRGDNLEIWVRYPIKSDRLQYRRSLPREGIDGIYVKSFGEKVIADFLFEHNIDYKYERNFWWDGRNYRPDFTISTGNQQGIVIEYFGLEGDPDYDKMSELKREHWDNQKQWQLLEFSPLHLKAGDRQGFCASLKQALEDAGMTCDRLSEDEIWQRVKDRAIDRFTRVVDSFVQRCRKRSLTLEDLSSLISSHHILSETENNFLKIAQVFYKSYLDKIKVNEEEDFDGLLQRATAIVSSVNTEFLSGLSAGDLKHLRYIFIDEYQDFSDLFYKLISAIIQQNSNINIFCVGDDWQAINGFAGSELRFYENFGQYFNSYQKLNISTNYRSAASIVALGNSLMQGLGTPARVAQNNQHIIGKVQLVDLQTIPLTVREEQEHSGDILTPAVLRLVDRSIKQGRDVVLLSRKNNLPWYINNGNKQKKSKNITLDDFLSLIRSYLIPEIREKVTISTVHKYKGLEQKTVIVLDAVPSCYPLLHSDLIFTRVFGDSFEKTIEEERRLFYVALTRAVENLLIITESAKESPFIEELKDRTKVSTLNWEDYPPIVRSSNSITVKVGNHPKRGNGTYAIKELLKADGYEWWKKTTQWKYWWRTYPAENFSFPSFLDEVSWLSRADGIEIRFYDDLEKELAIYRIERGDWTCIVDRVSNLDKLPEFRALDQF